MSAADIAIVILVMLAAVGWVGSWIFALVNVVKLQSYLKIAHPDRWRELHTLWGMR